jgi:hypothetical protein
VLESVSENLTDGNRSATASFSGRRVTWRRVAVVSCLGLALAEAIVVTACYAHERITLYVRRDESRVQDDPTDGRFAFFAPGIDRPPIKAAGEARVGDDEPILGVEIDGRARAYLIGAMSDKYRHVVNDVIGGRPVSVTYCDIRNCAVGFTGGRPGEPLALSQGGLFSGGMVVCVDKDEYAQETRKPVGRGVETPAFPYETMPLTRSTWGEWRRRHPQTDVCDDLPTAGG